MKFDQQKELKCTKQNDHRYLSEASSEGTAQESLQERDLRPGAEIRHWNVQNESSEGKNWGNG